MIRAGIQESFAPMMLREVTPEVQWVRIAEEDPQEVEVDMWIAPTSMKLARRQLPIFAG